MKKRLLTLESGAMLLLALHPALLWAGGAALSNQALPVLGIELLCLLLGVAARWLPIKRRILFAVAMFLAACGVLLLLPLPWLQRLMLVPFALTLFLLAAGAFRQAIENTGIAVMAIAALIYLAAAILLRAHVYPEALRGALFLGAALLIPVGFGVINRGAVDSTLSTHSGVTATTRLTVMNRLLSCLFSAVVLVVGCFDSVKNAVRAALAFIADMAGRVAAFLLSLFPAAAASSGGQGGGGSMFEGLGEGEEPSLFWVVMEEIVKYLAIALAAALLIFALYKLYQKCSSALKKWLKALQEKLLSTSEDYEDETVALRPDESRQGGRARAKRRRPLPARWEDMDAKDRIRYVCGVLMAKKSPRPADTARGLMEDQALTSAYETARYSNLPLTPDQAKLADAAYEKIKR